MFENHAHQTSYNRYFCPTIKVKDYNVMIDRKKFWSTSKKMLTYDNIQKIETSQEDDDIIDCLLDYVYFKSYYKIIAI